MTKVTNNSYILDIIQSNDVNPCWTLHRWCCDIRRYTKIVDLATRHPIGYRIKLFGALSNVIFGYAGSEDMFYVFLRCVIGDLVIIRDDPDK